MPKFAFEARNENGALTAGVISADSADDAGMMLGQRNLYVVRMGSETEVVQRRLKKGRASRADVAWQMSQLAIMVRTGIMLTDALEILANQATKPHAKALLEQVSKTVNEGRPLSEALAEFPGTYSPSLLSLIRAGEMSGNMTLVLDRSSQYLMSEMKAIKRIRSALMYPAFLFLACTGVTVFLLTVILPRFAAIFASRGAVLPLPTRMLMSLSHSLVADWNLWLGGTFALILLAVLYLRTARGRLQRDFLAVRAPMISHVFNKFYQSRAFRTLSILLQAGVPLLESMKVMRDVVPNTYYVRLWKDVDAHIQRGDRLAAPLLAAPFIPESIGRMIDCGDRSAKLGFVFEQLAEYAEDEYDQAIKLATQFIEPVMILLMGSTIGFVAASLMLPLFRSSLLVMH